MQRLIVSNDRGTFDSRVNEALSSGCMVVPGTLSMAMTSHRKRGSENNNFLQSRYAVIVEQPDDYEEPAEEAIAAGAGSLCQPDAYETENGALDLTNQGPVGLG